MSSPKSAVLQPESTDLRKATVAFVAPFLVYVAALAVEHLTGVSPIIIHPIRLCAVFASLLIFSRPYLDFRMTAPFASIVLGVAVFAIWVGPDLLFGYRHFILFENAITGTAASSVPQALRSNSFFIAVRTLSCVLTVPILEELFWRGWLLRWLVDKEFLKVPPGRYVPSAFWIVAMLFASEHGPYWEVGLIAGVAYNWWFIRTKSLADCMLAHAVTNTCLSVYVLATGFWRYWL